MGNTDKDIIVLGVGLEPVDKDQIPLIHTDKGSLFATGNIVLLKERDIPILFKEQQINTDSDMLFVPDDVVKTWIGENHSKDERR